MISNADEIQKEELNSYTQYRSSSYDEYQPNFLIDKFHSSIMPQSGHDSKRANFKIKN